MLKHLCDSYFYLSIHNGNNSRKPVIEVVKTEYIFLRRVPCNAIDIHQILYDQFYNRGESNDTELIWKYEIKYVILHYFNLEDFLINLFIFAIINTAIKKHPFLLIGRKADSEKFHYYATLLKKIWKETMRIDTICKKSYRFLL